MRNITSFLKTMMAPVAVLAVIISVTPAALAHDDPRTDVPPVLNPAIEPACNPDDREPLLATPCAQPSPHFVPTQPAADPSAQPVPQRVPASSQPLSIPPVEPSPKSDPPSLIPDADFPPQALIEPHQVPVNPEVK